MSVIPDVPVFNDALIPSDVTPTDGLLVCKECGDTFEYAGRGRKSEYCPRHRKSTASTGRRSKADNNGKNDLLAAQAASALTQINSLAEMGLRFTKMEMTAEALSMAKEAFREQAFEALRTDPELCKTILKGGVQSGRIALIFAYGMLASVVAPVATMEYKAKRADARERAEREDRAEVTGTTDAA